MDKPLASISMDLDNQWTYMKIHGDPGWEKFPSYLDTFIPHALKVLQKQNLKITFFVVGQDAALDKNKDYLRSIVKHGHEIGNHSFHHESWLHSYSRKKIESEILLAEEYIQSVTQQKTIGYRGPGFSWHPQVFSVLKDRGYLYDASILPTYIGPIARAYYFWTSSLSKEERQIRRGLFGGFRNGFRSVKPYFWDLGNNEKLLEIPVTTMPILKTPFHLSYLVFLAGISEVLMNNYLSLAIRLCQLTKTQPSFLLHPLDLIGGDQVPELKFFPGMNMCSNRKIEIFTKVINKLKSHFELVNMSTHAREITLSSSLDRINLNVGS